ncbi:MAG: anthranilate synthase component I family protein [Thermoanaerobaculales bacterium]|jgi:anthranilate synthase component 1|nr:anthranilate synthase component I family protein [Thermoanaerobaculales bacterium]
MEERPNKTQFLALARDYDVVPVVRELTSDTVTPFTVYSRLAARGRNPFLLESVEGGERVARYSFAGSDPFRIVELRDGGVLVDGVPEPGDPIEGLRRATDLGRVAPVDDLPPFAGGAMGYLSYDAVRLVEDIPATGRDEGGLPDGWYGLYDSVVALDRARQRLQIVVMARVESDPEAAWRTAVARLDALHGALTTGGEGPMPHTLPVPPGDSWDGWRVTPSDDEFLERVARAREYILAGDIFQVVPSRRWRRVPRCNASEIYRMLRVTNPSPYMFLFDTGNARILGSSPEMLTRVEGRKVSTCPIAGTRPRGADPEEDLRLEAELKADPKELAEHTMLVDLGRNDIGRVAVPGTVRVAREAEVERYSHVMHLVSEVQGELRDDCDGWDALFACFPAGTLSGAPKVRAMEIIDELEEVRRGVYGGAVGYRNAAGDMDSCIAIRTLVERGGVAHIQAGAGIVFDSVPATELDECRNKANALVVAVAMAEAAAKPQ